MKTKQVNDDLLLHTLFRAAGSARRNRDEKPPRRHKGFGRFLDLLSEGKLTQKEIARRLEVSAQAVSETVKILEERGLIRKEKSESDRRAWCISITPKGEKHRKEAKKERQENAERFFAVLTEKEKAELDRLLTKLLPKEDEK